MKKIEKIIIPGGSGFLVHIMIDADPPEFLY